MTKKIKKSKKSKASAPKEQTTMPLVGKGVAELRIQELDAALDKLIADDEALSAAKEARDDSKKAAVDIMHAHLDELVQEAKGGHSYLYDMKLFRLAPTGEKLTVKTVHDKNLGDADGATGG